MQADGLFAVKPDEPSAFIGQDALRRRIGDPLATRCMTVVLDSPDAYAWGGESLMLDDEPAGEITSAGWRRLGRALRVPRVGSDARRAGLGSC